MCSPSACCGLLLDGTPPAQILCLAYTKAAAANMADRVFSKLAQWTSLSDGALAKAIVESGADAPGPRDLIFARQLFARTIESPGGLKIQTLHAFAERLLRLFPFEANVPAHFNVLDESEFEAALARGARRGARRTRRLERERGRARPGGARIGPDQIRRASDGGAQPRRDLRRSRRRAELRRRASRSARSCARRDNRERRSRDAWRRRRPHATRAMGASPRRRHETRPENCREPSRGERRRRAPSSRPGAAQGVVQGGWRGRPSRRRERPTNDQESARKVSGARGRSASRAGSPAPVARAQARGADAGAQRRLVRRRKIDPGAPSRG